MKHTISVVVVFLFSFFIILGPAYSETAVATDGVAVSATDESSATDEVEEEVKIKTPCVLAGGGDVGFGDFAQKRPSCYSLSEEAVFSASIRRVSDREWESTVSNNSGSSYTLSVNIEQYNSGRKKIRTAPQSFRLKDGESKTRTFKVSAGTVGTVALLTRAKRMR